VKIDVNKNLHMCSQKIPTRRHIFPLLQVVFKACLFASCSSIDSCLLLLRNGALGRRPGGQSPVPHPELTVSVPAGGWVSALSKLSI